MKNQLFAGSRSATSRQLAEGGRASLPAGTERGDVPGWVMITLMTAALVVLLWTLAGPALTELFNNAINRILSI